MVFKTLQPDQIRAISERAAHDAGLFMVANTVNASSLYQGEHLLKKSGRAETFRQFREYIPGDEISAVDWKSSAKSDKVFVKQRESRVPRRYQFWCEDYKGMYFKSPPRANNTIYSKIEAAWILSIAAAILAVDNGDMISLMDGDTPKRGEKALGDMLHQLCDTFDAPPDISLMDLEPKKTASAFSFLIGDFLAPIQDLSKALESFNTHHVGYNGYLIQVLDRAELTLPYKGRVLFEGYAADNENTRFDIQNIESIRGQYIERMDAHNNAVKNIAMRHGFLYHLHVTDQPIAQSMRIIGQSGFSADARII